MTDQEKAKDWVICGRLIGQASGWDEAGDMTIILYDFVPHPKYKGLIAKDITIDLTDGTITTCNDDGETLKSCDLLDTIANLPRLKAI